MNLSELFQYEDIKTLIMMRLPIKDFLCLQVSKRFQESHYSDSYFFKIFGDIGKYQGFTLNSVYRILITDACRKLRIITKPLGTFFQVSTKFGPIGLRGPCFPGDKSVDERRDILESFQDYCCKIDGARICSVQ